jgi:hypothetical protein
MKKPWHFLAEKRATLTKVRGRSMLPKPAGDCKCNWSKDYAAALKYGSTRISHALSSHSGM